MKTKTAAHTPTLLRIKDARIVRLHRALERIAQNKCHHNTAPCCKAWQIATEALKNGLTEECNG